MSLTMRRGATLTLTAAVFLLAGCGGIPAPAPTTVTVQAPAPAALGAASSDAPGASTTVTLPDVVGQNGAIAQDSLRNLGLNKIDLAADATAGKQLVLIPENWHVTKIEPEAGAQVHTNQAVVLTMTK